MVARAMNMKWVGRLQPEKGTAARRALETYRSENIRDSHTAVALPRRGAPRSLVVAPGLMELGLWKTLSADTATLFTLQHSSMSGAVKSRQVTVKSLSSLRLRRLSPLLHSSLDERTFDRLPVIRNRLSVVHGSRLPYLFTYL